MTWQQKCRICGIVREGNSTSTCPNGCKNQWKEEGHGKKEERVD